MKTDVTWDLSDLYLGVADPRLDTDLQSIQQCAETFEQTYRGQIAREDLTADGLAQALQQYEELQRREARPGTFAQLHFTTCTTDPERGALLQKVREAGSRVATHLLFFDLEIGRIPSPTYERVIADPRLANYRHYLEHQRALARYHLSEPEEKIAEEFANTGGRAFGRLFTEVVSRIKYRLVLNGETRELEQSELLALFYHPERETRRAAASAVTEGLRGNAHVITFIFNTLLSEKATKDRLRGFEFPEHARHLGNELTREVVDTVVGVCAENFDLVADYYRLKRDLLRLDELTHYDRYAPLLETDTQVAFEDARALVLDAFAQFSPQLRAMSEPFFSKCWIDAALAPGKSGGAYCAAVAPDLHPYVFMNYTGKPRDVMTLAHELGHGLHDVLARRQTMLNFYPTLPLAETASTFAEMLTFDRLLRDLTDPREKLALVCEKIEDAFATVFRQVAMFRFEQDAHRARREQGEQTTENYSQLWQKNQQAMFGDAVTLGEDHAWWWLYVPHVFLSPFYVYAYAFGELLVLSLYARYQQEGPAFVDRYFDLLAAGGSEPPAALLQRTMGIDIASGDFWRGGVDLIRRRVALAKELAAQLQ